MNTALIWLMSITIFRVSIPLDGLPLVLHSTSCSCTSIKPKSKDLEFNCSRGFFIRVKLNLIMMLNRKLYYITIYISNLIYFAVVLCLSFGPWPFGITPT